MVEDPWPLEQSADRPGHKVIYLSLKVLIGGNLFRVEDALILQVFIDVRRGVGGVGPQGQLLNGVTVSVDDRL